MAIPGAFPRIAIRTFTLSINHLHIQYGNMAIKTTHSNWFFSNFGTFMYLSLRRPLSAKEKSMLFHP